jgi:hypothetical protein
MPRCRRRSGDRHPAPGHHDRVRAQPLPLARGAGEPLVPDQRPGAEVGRERVGEVAQERRMQVLGGGQAALAPVGFDPRVGAPGVEHAFVAADVHVAGRGRADDLGQDAGHRGPGVRQRRDEVRQDPPVGAHLVSTLRGLARAQFGERGQQRGAVAGQVDLRHQRHHPLGRVAGDLGEVGQGVVAAVRDLLVDRRLLAVQADPGARPVRPDLVQCREQAALDPPALIVGQVQVQPVDLHRGERVDEREQLALGGEVPGHIDVRAAPGQGWPVLDLGGGQVPLLGLAGSRPQRRGPPGVVGQQLAQRLRGVERARPVADRDAYALRVDRELVSLGPERRLSVHGNRDLAVVGPQLRVESRPRDGGEGAVHCCRKRAGPGAEPGPDGGLRRELEPSLALPDGGRVGHERGEAVVHGILVFAASFPAAGRTRSRTLTVR